MAMSGGVDRPGGRWSWARWHRIYYLLAAFDLLTVSMSLWVNTRIMAIYRTSIEVNQAWDELLHGTSVLGRSAAAVNASGNDVFESGDVEAEAESVRRAWPAFTARLAGLRAGVKALTSEGRAPDLLQDLAAVETATAAMWRESERIFAHLRQGEHAQAAERMASMDRQFADVNAALDSLRAHIASIQRALFAEQMAKAARVQRSQSVLAILILLMVAGATAYGLKIAGAVKSAACELEARVAERTAELLRANEVRDRLLRRVLSTQEDERRRIARDLHDEIGQSLMSLVIGLRNLGHAPSHEAVRIQMGDLERIAVSTIDEVRRLARGLRPSVLDDLGLPAAMERYAADYERSHGIPVDVEIPDPPPDRLPDEVETALYRIVQEALTNTAKHAAATAARVVVRRLPSSVQVTVEDNGCGFEAGDTDSGGRFGLSGMRERAVLLGGCLAVESRPGHGTRVVARIPLGEESDG